VNTVAPKFGQHRGPEKRHHGAHQKRQQGDDGRGVEAGLLDVRHHRRHAPALGAKQAAGDGFQNQADEAEQLQGVLPDRIHGAADARQELNADADFRFLDRHTEIRQRAVDRLQQRAVGRRNGAIGVFG
jgi:hypothetical protein